MQATPTVRTTPTPAPTVCFHPNTAGIPIVRLGILALPALANDLRSIILQSCCELCVGPFESIVGRPQCPSAPARPRSRQAAASGSSASPMNFAATAISDVLFITPEAWADERGFFMEAYRADAFAQAGLHAAFVQDNHSRSAQGVLRGLHYQIQHPQGKLVRVVIGEIFDVAVDLRRSSATFGQWVGVHLSAKNRKMLWVAPGFAHGFYALSEWAEVIYKVTDYYVPEYERTLRWDDPGIGIEWPLIDGRPPILSEKDAAGVRLKDADTYD